MTILYLLGGLLVLWILAAVLGFGSNTVFNNPSSMSDSQLERTIRLTGRILETAPVMSDAFRKAGNKHAAAMAELTRRHGVPMAPAPFHGE